MVQLSPIHYLLPLPPGLHNESNELFGFYTYEVRVGHSDRIWSTAQGRFGHPIRVNGVQHPAPPLTCLVDRTPNGIKVTAHYAQALFSGKDVTSKPPKTEIWCMLYAQVRQADDRKNRNILLSEVKLEYLAPQLQFFGAKLLPLNALSIGSSMLHRPVSRSGARRRSRLRRRIQSGSHDRVERAGSGDDAAIRPVHHSGSTGRYKCAAALCAMDGIAS